MTATIYKISTQQFRDLIASTSDAIRSCQGARGSFEQFNERRILSNISSELRAANCPRASADLRERANAWLAQADTFFR